MSHKHSTLPESHDQPDAWHQHTADEHPQEAHGENLAVPTVLIYGTVSFLLVVASVVGVIVYYVWYANAIKIEREERYDLAGVPGASPIQERFLELRAESELGMLKGLREAGGGFDRIVTQYSAPRGGRTE